MGIDALIGAGADALEVDIVTGSMRGINGNVAFDAEL